MKWYWTGHLGRMENDRKVNWAKKRTEWTPKTKETRGRLAR